MSLEFPSSSETAPPVAGVAAVPQLAPSVRDVLALVDGLALRGVPPAEAAKAAYEVLRHGPGQKLLTPAEIAPLVNRSVRTVQTWCENETVPVVKVGGATVGIHFPTFVACCTKFASGLGKPGGIAPGELFARLVASGDRKPH